MKETRKRSNKNELNKRRNKKGIQEKRKKEMSDLQKYQFIQMHDN